MRKKKNGFTLIEFLIAAAIVGTLAAAFVSLLAPQFMLYFYYPSDNKARQAGADLMESLLNGDISVKGIRYACPDLRNGSRVGLVSAGALTLRYVYPEGLVYRNVTLTYDPALDRVTRTVDQQPAVTIPQSTGPDPSVNVQLLEQNAFFRYYDVQGGEVDPAVSGVAAVYRVEIAFQVRIGARGVGPGRGTFLLKSGADVKHYAAG